MKTVTALSLLFIIISYNSAVGQTWQEYYEKGETCKDQSKYTDQCLDDFSKALELKTIESAVIDSAYVQVLYMTGFTLQQLSRNREALVVLNSCLKEGLNLYGENHELISDIYTSLSSVYSGLGKNEDAEIYINKNISLTKALHTENSSEHAIAIMYAGYLYTTLGKYKKAEDYFRKALEINRNNNPSDLMLAFSLMNIAIVYSENGNLEESETYINEAIKLLKADLGTQNQFYALLIGLKALIVDYLDKEELAEECYLESWTIFNELMGSQNSNSMSALSSLGDFYKSEKKLTKADSIYNLIEAVITKNKEESPIRYANILINRAKLWKEMGIYDNEVLEYLNKGIDIKASINGTDNKSLNSAKRSLAEYYFTHGNEEKAEELFKNTLDVTLNYLDESFLYLSETEREKVYSNVDFSIHAYQSFAIDRYEQNPNIAGDLFNLQMSYKSFLLNTTNNVKQQILQSGDRFLIDLYDEVQDLRQQTGYLINKGGNEEELRKMKEELRIKDRELTESASFYTEIQGDYRWQDIRSALKEGEAAVEVVRVKKYNYQISETDDNDLIYAILIITHETDKHPKLIKLVNGMDLEQKFAPAYKNLIKYRKKDTQSYDAFWTPIKKNIKSIDKVYFSADGVYHQIALETLQNPKTGDYLFDEVDIVSITSLKELIEPGSNTRSYNYAILFGNPDFGVTDNTSPPANDEVYQLERGEGIAPLPGTKKEIELINQIFESNNWKQSVYTELEASETSLKEMRRPKVLHIATHGFFKTDESQKNSPLFNSGLLLAGAAATLGDDSQVKENAITGSDDGILTAYEAMNLNLYGTELVILSACETGLGEIKNGEGVYGLQRALKVAGSKNILMSLWKVNDESTQELMVKFYEYWLNGNDKRQAFKKAQEELRQKYPHPYYWGAFMMIGI